MALSSASVPSGAPISQESVAMLPRVDDSQSVNERLTKVIIVDP
jgi:hypothetical protein